MNENMILVRRTALAAASLAAGGVLFAMYQFVRPFTDTAETMSSPAWVSSHLFGVVGFVLVGLGLLGLYLRLQPTPGEAWALRAVVVGGLGTGLTLPYYGAETFGLWHIARRSLEDGDPSLLELAEDFHAGALESTWFALGLLLMGVAAVFAAVAVSRSGILRPWSAVPLAVGYALLVPQFFTPQPVRMVHGALIAVGALWLAFELWKSRASAAQTASGRSGTPSA